MFCNKCGQALPDNATFCTNCGNSIGQPQQNANPNVQQPQGNVQQPNPNPQQPNQGFGFNNQNGNQMPQQPVKTEPSPVLKWLESAKDVFLSFFKKGYEDQPANLLKEKNHMWLVFSVVAVLLGGLSLLLLAVSTTSAFGGLLSGYINKFPFFVLGFFASGSLFFGFATMLFVLAKIVKNNNVTYINALNSTSVAFIPVILATAGSCIFNLFSVTLATIVTAVAIIMFVVLIMNSINTIIANTNLEKSFWAKAIALISAFAACVIVIAIIFAIIKGSVVNVSSAYSGLSSYLG